MEKQVRMQAARWLAEQEMMPQALLQPGDTPSESELAALAEYGCGVLSGSGLPVTYEALRDEIIGALTGEKGENR